MDKKEALKVLSQAVNDCELRCDGPHLVVLDKGWIFHGNLIPPTSPGEDYTLTDVVNVRKWSQGGFGALALSSVKAGATLDPCASIKFRREVMIFSVPTKVDWRS